MITSLPPRCISGLAKEAGTLWGWSLMMFILSLGAAWAQTHSQSHRNRQRPERCCHLGGDCHRCQS
jgi:hypothetical protein